MTKLVKYLFVCFSISGYQPHEKIFMRPTYDKFILAQPEDMLVFECN